MWAIFSILTLLAAEPDDGRATVVVIVGAPGTAEYAAGFGKWADRWGDASERGSARFIQIGRDDTSGDDKQRLRETIESESKNTTQPLWLVLIGHGTYDGRDAKFNLRGEDVSDKELAEWLRPVNRPTAVVVCASASAPFLNRLSGKNRVVITATRNGGEIQFSHFGDFLSAAITDPAADLDKDAQTSLLEAFLAASHHTAEFYQQAGRLATEHALLDDNGDALGTGGDWFSGSRATRSARSGAPLDGPRAHQWHLVKSAAELQMPPQLRERRDELELAVESLRQKKPTMSESDYYAQLEKLLVELAQVYEQTEKVTSDERR